jgi:hypothetical protein
MAKETPRDETDALSSVEQLRNLSRNRQVRERSSIADVAIV